MAKSTTDVDNLVINVLTEDQYIQALNNGEIDTNQLYLTPEKKLIKSISQSEYDSMKNAGTLDSDILYVTPAEDISDATQSQSGYMSASDKAKLDNIASGANYYVHPSYTSKSNGFYKVTVDNTGHVSGTTSVSKSDITTALGYTPPTQNTTYSAASSFDLGLVKIGSNITGASDGTISVTYNNVVNALGYTPSSQNTTYSAATSSTLGLVKIGSNITNSYGTISLTKSNVTNALGYTPPTSDTNTWRGIQNTLTSDSTSDSLSAAQGKVLKRLVDGKAPASHTHTKSQITDFPTSMPASDVSAWAKAATKPSYTKAEVGLGNVDNTADVDKSVKFATSAGSAGNGVVTSSVGYDGSPGYVRFDDGVQICWGVGYTGDARGSFSFPQSFLHPPCVMISGTGAYRYAFYITNNTSSGFDYYRDGSGSTVNPQYAAFGRWK